MPSAEKRSLQFVFDGVSHIAQPFEIVERKGIGHPDTLADALGEYLSVVYSQYTLKQFGAVLHHNFDKVGLMGGHAHVSFGGGELTQPIRVLLNGRASGKFGDTPIPVQEMLIEATLQFLGSHFPMLDPATDLRILYEVSTGSSPGAVNSNASVKEGKRKYWFEPRSLDDLPERRFLHCNDTSLGCAFAPYTDLERMVFGLEQMLNGAAFKLDKPWLGSDIKIMAKRFGCHVDCTIAVPQICAAVPGLQAYRENLELIREHVVRYCRQHHPLFDVSLTLNARDDYEAVELYLTYTGSSIESGDEGFVGRGNRVGGFIAPLRPYTMEGVCGKNPVYHTGKLYCVAAHDIAWRIYEETGSSAAVYLIGQSGQSLARPWQGVVRLDAQHDEALLQRIFESTLHDMSVFTNKILNREYTLC